MYVRKQLKKNEKKERLDPSLNDTDQLEVWLDDSILVMDDRYFQLLKDNALLVLYLPGERKNKL